MATNQGTERELASSARVPARDKTWPQITDEDIIEALRFAQTRDPEGVARSVEFALSYPRAEQWGAPSVPANAALGLGLIPQFGPGSAPQGAVTRRLKKLAAEGRVERVEMVRPRGKPAPPAWRLPVTDNDDSGGNDG